MSSTSDSEPNSAYVNGPTLIAEVPPLRRPTGRRALKTPILKESVGRAVLYLRVSTKSQVNTDYDPEGISIPAQRLACQRKAEQLGLEIVDEYIEPGRSATEMTKRVKFQEMLTRIRRSRDVDHVVVYKLSRMSRNRVDDAIVMADLRKRGVALISATESIDDTPQGQLMHGILAAFNEFRSSEEGVDIAYKMGEKAKKGGTLGLAPLGYENIVDRFEGRQIRTVAVDVERAEFVKIAFELYATGNYTISDLQEELTDRGLRTRPTAARPAAPVSTSKLRDLLCDRYYLGVVTYKGIEYEGRHPALISEEVFDRVQQLLDERGVSGERRRVNHHYLKGSLFCGHCHTAGRVPRRMILQRAIGRNGNTYYYFFCRGVQDHTCSAPYSRRLEVEDAVVEHYRTIQFTPTFLEQMRLALKVTLADDYAAQRLLKKQLSEQLTSLTTKEENLIDLAADAALAQT